MNVKDIKVTIDTEWVSGLSKLIAEVKYDPTTERLTELSLLIEEHTGRIISVEELLPERDKAVARLRKLIDK